MAVSAARRSQRSDLRHSAVFSIRALLRILASVVLGGYLVAAPLAKASQTLQGNYLSFNVNDEGGFYEFGDDIRYDATGAGSFGSPTRSWTPYYDAFALEYDTTSAESFEGNLSGFTSHTPATLLAPGAGGFDQSVSWTGSIAGKLDVTHVYGLNADDKKLQVKTTITAIDNLTDVKFAHKVLPYNSGSNVYQRGNATLGLATGDFRKFPIRRLGPGNRLLHRFGRRP